MINTKFEAYKIHRELKKIGKEYEFYRAKLNDFKEPTNDEEFVCKLLGLYHEQSGNISILLFFYTYMPALASHLIQLFPLPATIS